MLKYDYKKLPPFKGMVLQNFPFIEEDFDAITNYQLLCKIVEYLNIINKNDNIMIDNINALNNWFNNLDVQDEIDNKLDQMVEDGTLQEIIASYLNSNALWCFKTVNDMKEATNLINGSYAKTLGYYNVDDGGSATYYISNTPLVLPTNDNYFVLKIGDLYANLIIEDNNVNIKQATDIFE